jgi:GST-like protein
MSGKTYTLYGSRGSGSAAVEAALELARVPYRMVGAASWEPKSALAELKRVNPLQQIPTLVCPDGTVLTESAAILIHLGLAHPRSGLLPADAMQRARALRAIAFIAANCYAAIGIIDYPQRWLGKVDQAACEQLRTGTRKRLHKLWRLFADQFAPQPESAAPAPAAGQTGFLFGESPGAADLLAAVVSHWSGARKHLARQRPALHALLLRVESHPPVAGVFQRHWGDGPVVITP